MLKQKIITELDNQLIKVKAEMKFLENITIDTQNELEQKQQFLQGMIKEPKFSYTKAAKFDHEKYKSNLDNIIIPNSFEMSSFYEQIKQNRFLENQIIKYCGDPNVIIPFSAQLFGKPCAKNHNKALKILQENIISQPEQKYFTAEQLKKKLEQTLQQLDITGWDIIFSEKKETTLYSSRSEISICQDRKFTEKEMNRLPIHEIGGHLLRVMNGREQKYGILSTGLTGYSETEEGITTHLEKITNTLDQRVLRTYAGRFIAVESVLHRNSFSNTYEELLSLQFSPEEAWTLSVRAHRGGGLIKDHIYLQGFHKITEYLAAGGSLEKLYIGKIGIEHVDFMDSLEKKGEIKKPKYLPYSIINNNKN
jgi:uncharacterized protein (TIGR02421 family)